MQSVRVADFITMAEHVVSFGPQDKKTLPAGSFVKMIEPKYVPKHVLERAPLPDPAHFDGVHHYYYCSYGIVVMPAKIVREA